MKKKLISLAMLVTVFAMQVYPLQVRQQVWQQLEQLRENMT